MELRVHMDLQIESEMQLASDIEELYELGIFSDIDIIQNEHPVRVEDEIEQEMITLLRDLDEVDEIGQESLAGSPAQMESLQWKKKCIVSGCLSNIQCSKLCHRHGGYKICSVNSCTNQVRTKGVCIRHGAKRKTKLTRKSTK